MIVTCEECSTSFQLDEARIPPSGARVRCSRCKHAFFLPHPSASRSEAVHAVAEQAVADPAPAPPAHEDLAGVAPDESQTSPLTQAGEAAPPEPEPEEDDWQFTEEVRIAGEEETESDPGADLQAAAADTSLAEDEPESAFGETSDFSEGFDASALEAGLSVDDEDAWPGLDEPPVAAAAAADEGTGSGLELDSPPSSEPDLAEDADQRDESSFGTVQDFSAMMEDEQPGLDADLADSGASLGDAGAGPTAGSDGASGTGAAPVGTYAETGPTDDLGDPESWDLVGGDDFTAASKALGRSGTAADALVEDSPFDDAEPGFDDSLYQEGPSRGGALLAPLAIVGRALGWGVTLALIGAALFFAARTEVARWAQAPQRVSFGPLVAETTSVGWVETARAGFVLRFEGSVRNTGASPIQPADVRLALLDEAGEPVVGAPIPASWPLDARVLREASPDRFEASVRAATKRFARTPLAPGETRRFEALARDEVLPGQAKRVLLEVGPSRTLAQGAPDSGLSP